MEGKMRKKLTVALLITVGLALYLFVTKFYVIRDFESCKRAGYSIICAKCEGCPCYCKALGRRFEQTLPTKPKNQVLVSTDKTSYEQGKAVRITVKNNSPQPIYCFRKDTFWGLEKRENNTWKNVNQSGRESIVLPTTSPDGKEDCALPLYERANPPKLAPGSSIDQEWAQKICDFDIHGQKIADPAYLEPGTYRIKFTYSLKTVEKDGWADLSEPTLIYSPQFFILLNEGGVKKLGWLMTHTLSGGLTPCGNETKLTINESGEYLYEITPGYEAPAGCPKNKSTKTGKISASELEELKKILSDQSLLSLKDKYENPPGLEVSDLPVHIFTFKIGNKTKETTILQPPENLPPALEDAYIFSLKIREKYVWDKNL